MSASTIIPARRALRQWFLAILLVKTLWLTLFISLRNPEWYQGFVVGHIGLNSGDSKTYYQPIEELISTGQYGGVCRMPGILPVYLPLRLIFNDVNALQGVVVVQVIFDSIATLLIAIIAARIFSSLRAFKIVVFISCITTFTALRNIYLLSDSLCISSLITSTYFLSTYLTSQHKKNLLYAGIFMAWSIFLRQITILAIPVMVVIIAYHDWKSFKKIATASFLLIIPLAIALGSWTLRNRITYNRNIVLVAPLHECMYNLTPESEAIRNMIIALGEDFQPWSKGGGAYWFFNQPFEEKTSSPFQEEHYTSVMKGDELLLLRADYRKLSDPDLATISRDSLQASVVNRAVTYTSSYKLEHKFSYYIGNKVRFFAQFWLPDRIDDIPFPSMDKMNILQRAIKAWSLISLWMIHLLALVVTLYWVVTKRFDFLVWTLLPFSFIVALSYLGYIEQRYLATSFPFFIMIVAGAYSQLKSDKQASTLSTANN